MTPPRPPALSAPDVIGPTSILQQPISGPRSARRSKNRPYRHIHLEFDLVRAAGAASPPGVLHRLEEWLGVRKIVESADLIRLSGTLLHALSARGFRRVDHWEVVPGGWLPLPEPSARPGKDETVGHLLTALDGVATPSVAKARSFRVRLSDLQGKHLDAQVRRTHRSGRHAITLDGHGVWTRDEVEALKGALARRLPIEHSELTKFQYVDGV
jgi:hypothetical protein